MGPDARRKAAELELLYTGCEMRVSDAVMFVKRHRVRLEVQDAQELWWKTDVQHGEMFARRTDLYPWVRMYAPYIYTWRVV